MKTIWICLFIACIVPNRLEAAEKKKDLNVPVRTISEFNALFRALDLNDAIQDRYAITKLEYARLQTAWQGLSEENQACLLNPECGWTDFAAMFMFDLFLRTSWEVHVRKAAGYGALDISLTESVHNSVLYLKRARKTLVDWIHDTPGMQQNGQLIVSQHIDSEIERRVGRKSLKRLLRWEALINEYQNASEEEKLEAVSRFFAVRIRQTPDAWNEKGNDYWQSPIETLIRGLGDCDDFAMAHYVSLRLLGIPADRLHIAIVSDPENSNHGVVFLYSEGDSDPWVVDNLLSERFGAEGGRIQRLSVRMRLDQLQPHWIMNEFGISEFQEENFTVLMSEDFRHHFPAFTSALSRSHSLLQMEEKLYGEAIAYFRR